MTELGRVGRHLFSGGTYREGGERLERIAATFADECPPYLRGMPGIPSDWVRLGLLGAIARTVKAHGLIEWSDNPYTRDRRALCTTSSEPT